MMAGRPKRRAKLAREAMEAAPEVIPPVEVVGPDEVELVEMGEKSPPGQGNGVRRSFADLSKEELRIVQERGRESRRRKAQLKKLGEMQAWYEANKELAGLVFGAKAALLDGLLRKGLGEDGVLDVALFEKHEMDTLFKMIGSYEDRMFGKSAQRIEHSGNVEVQHRVAQIIEGLSEGG
jgi:hypothetical protein